MSDRHTAPAGEGFLDGLAAQAILPLLTVPGPLGAADLGAALVRAGLPIIEVAIRRPGAVDALAEIASVGGAFVGAGSVRSAAQVDEVVGAGARFVISPGFSPAVATACADHGLPLIPGVATASEILAALDLGLEVLKFFPAATSGGVAALAAFAGPFPEVRFIPTGGIGEANAAGYLDLPNVIAVGGSWLVAGDVLARGDLDGIADAAARALAALSRRSRER